MSKKNKHIYKSNCCNANVKVGGIGDFEKDKLACTMYHVCTKCGNACDVHIIERKTWAINPKTRIVPNKKRLFTDKELRKLHQEEDF